MIAALCLFNLAAVIAMASTASWGFVTFMAVFGWLAAFCFQMALRGRDGR